MLLILTSKSTLLCSAPISETTTPTNRFNMVMLPKIIRPRTRNRVKNLLVSSSLLKFVSRSSYSNSPSNIARVLKTKDKTTEIRNFQSVKRDAYLNKKNLLSKWLTSRHWQVIMRASPNPVTRKTIAIK